MTTVIKALCTITLATLATAAFSQAPIVRQSPSDRQPPDQQQPQYQPQDQSKVRTNTRNLPRCHPTSSRLRHLHGS